MRFVECLEGQWYAWNGTKNLDNAETAAENAAVHSSATLALCVIYAAAAALYSELYSYTSIYYRKFLCPAQYGQSSLVLMDRTKCRAMTG